MSSQRAEPIVHPATDLAAATANLAISLCSSRFLKTILARHKYGPLVIKVFIKPDASMTLRVIQRRLKCESESCCELAVDYYRLPAQLEAEGYGLGRVPCS
jgi:hypothetical protein